MVVQVRNRVWFVIMNYTVCFYFYYWVRTDELVRLYTHKGGREDEPQLKHIRAEKFVSTLLWIVLLYTSRPLLHVQMSSVEWPANCIKIRKAEKHLLQYWHLCGRRVCGTCHQYLLEGHKTAAAHWSWNSPISLHLQLNWAADNIFPHYHSHKQETFSHATIRMPAFSITKFRSTAAVNTTVVQQPHTLCQSREITSRLRRPNIHSYFLSSVCLAGSLISADMD